VELYKKVIAKSTGKSFPNNPREQLQMSINAVLVHGIMIGPFI